MFVDDVDVTAYVQPQDGFINWRIPKTISFVEPMNEATLAIEGYEFYTPQSSPQYVFSFIIIAYQVK